MKLSTKNFATIAIAGTILFAASCKKDEVTNPTPGPEPELITTLRLEARNVNTGFSQTFTYKVESGFGSSTLEGLQIDTVKLEPNTKYGFTLTVLNEKASPAEDITEEIKEEKDEHLFLYQSSPTTGAGSLTFSNGIKDNKGLPFNQIISALSGEAGSGKLTITLKHEPTNKEATSPDAAGGETDLEAVFPVVLK